MFCLCRCARSKSASPSASSVSSPRSLQRRPRRKHSKNGPSHHADIAAHFNRLIQHNTKLLAQVSLKIGLTVEVVFGALAVPGDDQAAVTEGDTAVGRCQCARFQLEQIFGVPAAVAALASIGQPALLKLYAQGQVIEGGPA